MTVYMTIHGQGKPLVLFHGWGFDSNVWSSILPSLCAHYQVYLIDLPGFGFTPYCAWDAFKASILTKLPQQFAIIGWSMGGIFGTRLALEAPLRVTAMLNITSSPYFIKTNDWPGIEESVFRLFYDDLLTDTSATLSRFIQLQSRRVTGGSILPKKPPTKLGLEGGLQLLSQCDLRTSLLNQTTPVGYIFGHLDAIVPRATLPFLQHSHPHLQLIMLPKAAHMPFISHPDALLTVIRDFLK